VEFSHTEITAFCVKIRESSSVG